MQPLLESQLHPRHSPWQRYGSDHPQTVASDDTGKLISKFDSLENSIRKMSLADPRKR